MPCARGCFFISWHLRRLTLANRPPAREIFRKTHTPKINNPALPQSTHSLIYAPFSRLHRCAIHTPPAPPILNSKYANPPVPVVRKARTRFTYARGLFSLYAFISQFPISYFALSPKRLRCTLSLISSPPPARLIVLSISQKDYEGFFSILE
jgi:hypothetical protein